VTSQSPLFGRCPAGSGCRPEVTGAYDSGRVPHVYLCTTAVFLRTCPSPASGETSAGQPMFAADTAQRASHRDVASTRCRRRMGESPVWPLSSRTQRPKSDATLQPSAASDVPPSSACGTFSRQREKERDPSSVAQHHSAAPSPNPLPHASMEERAKASAPSPAGGRGLGRGWRQGWASDAMLQTGTASEVPPSPPQLNACRHHETHLVRGLSAQVQQPVIV